MSSKKIFFLILLILVLLIISFFIFKKIKEPSVNLPYKIETPQKRNIFQTINATGVLSIKNNIKVGSLVAGTIKEIYVKENDKVKKGDLLAQVDNGKEDTDVKKSQGEVEKASAELEYQEKYYYRQEQLYKAGQISKDSFESITKNLKTLRADLKIKKAELEQKTIEFNNTKIYAPTTGIIVDVGITKGMAITTNLDATVLFQIADNINDMSAEIDIDESDIGQIKNGQKVHFKVGTYLDKTFKGIINDVSYSPKLENSVLSYKAFIDVDNKDQLLRPGMTINAKIKIAKCINCLSLSCQAFLINKKQVEFLAKALNYRYIPMEEKNKKEIEKSNKNYTIKYVWIEDQNSLIEKAIKVNVTDDNYFEIKSGVTEQDKVIIDIESQDEMEKLYKKVFSGVL